MHEFNVCQVIVDTALAEMKRCKPPARRLTRATVVIGGLRQVVPENLQFAYETMTKDTPAEGSELEIKLLPMQGTCRKCGWAGVITGMGFKCGSCGSAAGEISGGREMYLESLEVEEDG